MKACKLVSNLLEHGDDFTAFQQSMQQATAEFLADQNTQIYGGVRPDARRAKDAYDINCGLCEEWAQRVYELYLELTGKPDVEYLDAGNISGNDDDSLECGHVFLRFKGKYYDAECPQGVRQFWQLPLFQKNGWKNKVKPMPEIDIRKLMGEGLDPLEPNSNDDPVMARIRKRVARAKADRIAQSPETQALDDPETFIKGEVAKRAEPIKKLEIVGRRWYRRGAGGVYCKAYIYINDKLIHTTPEQYGYGDHYLTLATQWLRDNGYIDLDDRTPIWHLRDKGQFELNYYVTDVKRERDL